MGPLAVGGERLNSSESFWPGVKEARRFAAVEGVGGGELSLDMFEGFVCYGRVDDGLTFGVKWSEKRVALAIGLSAFRA